MSGLNFRKMWLASMVSMMLAGALAQSAQNEQAKGIDLSGNWSGHWENSNNCHTGPLHATFCKCDDTHYKVNFTGKFFKVIPFRYSVTLDVTKQEGDKVLLSGESNLGRMFGTFTYSAEATATDFVATYTSCKYEGKFVLKRCCH